MSEIRRYSECQTCGLIAADKNGLINHSCIDILKEKLEASEAGIKKAFWGGFEMARLNPRSVKIPKHWNVYKKFKV
jgi:hypothetical protein